MWRHLTPHDAPRPWQRRATVDRDGFDDGQQQVVLILCDGAWHRAGSMVEQKMQPPKAPSKKKAPKF